MNIQELDTVVLESDIADHGLKKGDIGAVVALYSSDCVEVEFVTASGHTQALVTLSSQHVRPVGTQDMPSVRPVSAA